jgi:hypothetical protein
MVAMEVVELGSQETVERNEKGSGLRSLSMTREFSA